MFRSKSSKLKIVICLGVGKFIFDILHLGLKPFRLFVPQKNSCFFQIFTMS